MQTSQDPEDTALEFVTSWAQLSRPSDPATPFMCTKAYFLAHPLLLGSVGSCT